MNVHFSFKTAKTPDVEKEIQQQVDKLSRRLQVFRPELVHLRGGFVETQTKTGGFGVTLNLRLPSGQMAAQQDAPTATAAVKAAFREIFDQLNAHKDLLRNRHKWRRIAKEHRRVPFEHTLAAVPADGKPANGSTDTREAREVHWFINNNLQRLNRYIDREINFRINSGLLAGNLISKEEVLDEAIAAALSGEDHRPESLSTERWLYGLALRSIQTVATRNGDDGVTIHFEEPAGKQNVTGSDELWLQFHQPDDFLNEESVLADPSRTTPELVAASDEFISQIEAALAGATAVEREAFVLLAIEGFTAEEIAQVTGRSLEQVKKSIELARTRVEQKLPSGNALKKELLKHSRTA